MHAYNRPTNTLFTVHRVVESSTHLVLGFRTSRRAWLLARQPRVGIGRRTLWARGMVQEQCCSQEAFLQGLMVTVGTAASAGYYWSDGRWLDCRRAAAVDEHADSSGLGRAADMDFDGRRKLGTSTSSNTFGMLDGVLLIAAVMMQPMRRRFGRAVVPVASRDAQWSCSTQPWPWCMSEHCKTVVFVCLYLCVLIYNRHM